MVEVRLAGHVAVVDGTILNLTPNELGLLAALVDGEGSVLTREQLAENAWGRPLAPATARWTCT